MAVTIDEISAEWAKDAADFRDNHDIVRHSQEQYTLHHKYHTWYNQCVYKKIRLDGEFERLKRDKMEYYNGEMDLTTIKEKGWPLKPKILAKSEISKYIMSDDDVIIMVQRINALAQTIEFLDNIIKMISFRHMNVKNIIDYERFTSGQI